jgi:hypothetical protein
MQRFAKELVALQPELVLSSSTPTTAALLQETRTIPIIFASIVDPVGSGFIASLSRPGGKSTIVRAHQHAAAERYFRDDPGTAIFKLRQFAELLSKTIAARHALYLGERETLPELPPATWQGTTSPFWAPCRGRYYRVRRAAGHMRSPWPSGEGYVEAPN